MRGGLLKPVDKAHRKKLGQIARMSIHPNFVFYTAPLPAADKDVFHSLYKNRKQKKAPAFASAFPGRGRRLRTLGLRFWRPPLYQLSYSPLCAGRPQPARIIKRAARTRCIRWWTVRDSNPGPTGYEPVALPTELTVNLSGCRHDIVAAIPFNGAPCRIRTYDPAVNSRMLYLLS